MEESYHFEVILEIIFSVSAINKTLFDYNWIKPVKVRML